MKISWPTIFFLILLLLLPAAIFFEHVNSEDWNARLLWPNLNPEPDRHTPLNTAGTFLPTEITKDTELTAQNNPVILPTLTRVNKNVSLTIAAGTKIYAHEYGQLIVEGALVLNGTQAKPIEFTTNEKNAANRTWSGIILESGSEATINYTNFRFASPAVSCMAGSKANINYTDISLGQLGIFTAAPDCNISFTTIHNVYDGISVRGVSPLIKNSSVTAEHKNIIESSVD